MTTNPAELLEEYQKKGFNILTPSITLEGLSEHHHATVETVLLSAENSVGDVYPHKSEDSKTPPDRHQFRIAKQGLDKLAVLAGIIWHEQGGSRRIDDRKDRDYVAFEAFGAIRKADGQLVPVKAFYDLDFLAIQEDLEYQYRAKGGKKGQYQKKGKELDEYVEFCVGRDMRSKRKHRATLCESGARNRVIRALLGIKKVYTGKELSKPFVCIRITYQPDYNDPEVKRIATLAALGAQSNIYGIQTEPQQQLQAPGEDVPYVEEEEDEPEVIDTEPNGVDDEEPGLDEDFENWDRASREKYLENLAKTKNYDLTALLTRMKTNLNKLTDVQILSMKGKFSEMPDDDIPY